MNSLYYATRAEAAPLVTTYGIGGGDPVNLAADPDLAVSFAYVSDFLLAGHAKANLALFVVDVALLDGEKLRQGVDGAWLGEGCFAYSGEIPAFALRLERFIEMANEALDAVGIAALDAVGIAAVAPVDEAVDEPADDWVDMDVWGDIEALL